VYAVDQFADCLDDDLRRLELHPVAAASGHDVPSALGRFDK
jgi:hypothetical protein